MESLGFNNRATLEIIRIELLTLVVVVMMYSLVQSIVQYSAEISCSGFAFQNFT